MRRSRSSGIPLSVRKSSDHSETGRNAVFLGSIIGSRHEPSPVGFLGFSGWLTVNLELERLSITFLTNGDVAGKIHQQMTSHQAALRLPEVLSEGTNLHLYLQSQCVARPVRLNSRICGLQCRSPVPELVRGQSCCCCLCCSGHTHTLPMGHAFGHSLHGDVVQSTIIVHFSVVFEVGCLRGGIFALLCPTCLVACGR